MSIFMKNNLDTGDVHAEISKKVFAHRKYAGGFTIVELMIVIVVIAILASISIVAYDGIQARAEDSKTKTAVSQLEKVMILWSGENGNVIRGGSGSSTPVGASGCTEGSSGWFASGIYTCSQEENFVAAKMIPSGFTNNLPKNVQAPAYNYATNGRFSLMFYTCGTGKYILFWSLRNPTVEDTAGFDSSRTECGYGSNNSFRDTYGMRGARVIRLL